MRPEQPMDTDYLSQLTLMNVSDDTRYLGKNFHLYLRKRIPSMEDYTIQQVSGWPEVRDAIEKEYSWEPGHRFEWKLGDYDNRLIEYYCLHLKGGMTLYKTSNPEKIRLIHDTDTESGLVDEIREKIKSLGTIPDHRVGLIQMSYGTLNVRFVEFRPYELEITPFLGEEYVAFKRQMLAAFKEPAKGGLYLIHGEPGTGKTSFLKEILKETDKQALFIPPSIAGELGNPNLIALLMEHPNSVLIIEDADTILMKREADNSDAVSNLLNLTDGFPSDFLNLTIICTFNTRINDIDPALLRKGRLRGIHEFKKLSTQQARELAEFLEVNIEIHSPLSITEICNADVSLGDITESEVGFVNNGF